MRPRTVRVPVEPDGAICKFRARYGETKRCSHCKLHKSTDDFTALRTDGDLLQAWCRDCQRARPKAVVFEFECESCHQLHKRKANAQSKAVRERKICWLCSRRAKLDAKGGRPVNYTGSKHFAGKTLAMWKHSAGRRNHVWDVDKDQLDNQYSKQGGLCALTGLKMGGGSKSPYRPSIDRIDSSKGYFADNVQFVCSVVNVMKNKISEPEFIRLCGLIARNRGD